MPFAEDAGPVAGLLKLFGQRRRPKGQALALQDGMRHAILELMPSREQRAPRRCARWRDLKIDEPDALRAKLVDVRRLEDRITMGAQVAISLVVGEDEEDVRLSRGGQ